MKEIRVKTPYNAENIEVDEPSISDPNDVLMEVKLAGICGSDVHIYHGISPVAAYLIIPGHEISGEVLDTGAGAGKLKRGDRYYSQVLFSEVQDAFSFVEKERSRMLKAALKFNC